MVVETLITKMPYDAVIVLIDGIIRIEVVTKMRIGRPALSWHRIINVNLIGFIGIVFTHCIIA